MARRKRRRYQVPDDVDDGGCSITASELRRASADTQIKVMREWFYANYRDPVDCCPYESAEGGYQFIWGGPYAPREELEQEFGGVAREKAIAELAEELWNVTAEWTGPDRPEDIDDYFFDSLARSSGPLGEFRRSIDDVRQLMGVSVDGPHEQCLIRLLYVNVITALEAYLSDFFSSAITEHSELKRRFVETNPDFQAQKISISEVFDVWEGMDAKVKEYLVDVVWHHLARVRPMFRDVLGVEFPAEMHGLFLAVLIRHDIVHRNGRKKDGGEHTLKREDIEALIAMAESLVDTVEGQWLKVKPGRPAEPEVEI